MDAIKAFDVITEANFRLRAFRDYCEDKAQATSSVLTAISQAISVVPDDPDTEQIEKFANRRSMRANDPAMVETGGTLGTTLSEILLQSGLSADAAIPLNEGYVSAGALLSYVQEYTTDHMNGVSAENLPTLVMYGSDGAPREVNMSFDEICTNLQSSLHSVTVMAAAAGAMSMEKASDRITMFNDSVQRTFQNTYQDVSNTGAAFRDIITNATTPNDFFGAMSRLFQAPQLETGELEFPSQLDCNEYLGANPVTALGIGQKFGVVGQALGVVAKGVGGLLSGMGKLIGKAFSWVSKQVNETFVNPYDIVMGDGEVYGINNLYSAAGFSKWYEEYDGKVPVYRQQALLSDSLSKDLSDFDSAYFEGNYLPNPWQPLITVNDLANYPFEAKDAQQLKDALESCTHRKIYFRTVFGEMLFELEQSDPAGRVIAYPNAYSNRTGTSNSVMGCTLSYKMMFRPFSVNRRILLQSMKDNGNWANVSGIQASDQVYRQYNPYGVKNFSVLNEQEYRYMLCGTDEDFEDVIARATSMDGFYNNPKNVSERELYEGFWTSCCVLTALAVMLQPQRYFRDYTMDAADHYEIMTPTYHNWFAIPTLAYLYHTPSDAQAKTPTIHISKDSPVTNRDFFELCCGSNFDADFGNHQRSALIWNPSYSPDYDISSDDDSIVAYWMSCATVWNTPFYIGAEPVPIKSYRTDSSSTIFFLTGYRNLAVGFIFAWIRMRFERKSNPTDYQFVPFRDDKEGFPIGKFSIRTDAENQNKASNFVAAAIVVAIAIVTTVVAGVVVKKVARSIQSKRLANKFQLEQKMYDGEKLNSSEMRRYNRINRKLSASATASRGLQSNPLSSADNTTDCSDTDVLLSSQALISGDIDSANAALNGISNKVANTDKLYPLAVANEATTAAVEATVVASHIILQKQLKKEQSQTVPTNTNGGW